MQPTRMFSRCRRSFRRCAEGSSSRRRARGSISQTKNPKSSRAFSSTYTYVHTLRGSLYGPCILEVHLLMSSFIEGRLLPPLGPQQAQKLLGTRGCREEPKPRKSRWSRIRRGHNIHLQRGRPPIEGYSHILCGGEVWLGGAQTPCPQKARSAEWNRGLYNPA